MNVWQIATGETGRDYRELFWAYDIMILGPSRLGDARENQYADGVPNSAHSQVHSFAHKPQPGDRLVMRFGREVIGVGEIPAEDDAQYSFNEVFACVYGWDLCHCRRVVWARDYELGDLKWVYRHAKQKPSFTQVHEPHVLQKVRAIDSQWFRRPLEEMPKPETSQYGEYELGTLGAELFQAGISNKNIEDILKALQQADRLCRWYWSPDCGRKPSENEVVSHVILPLFLGLGWSHQQIAVEWNWVDMAFFKRTPTTPSNCIMVLEAKGLGRSLGEVLKQPKKSVQRLGLTHVRYILTTDGANLFVYERSGEEWRPNPVAYLSVWSPQRQYVIPKNTSAIDTLVRLQPSTV